MDLGSQAGIVLGTEAQGLWERTGVSYLLDIGWGSDSPTGVPLGQVSVSLSVKCVVVPDWEGKKPEHPIKFEFQITMGQKQERGRGRRQVRVGEGAWISWPSPEPWVQHALEKGLVLGGRDLSPWGQSLASVRGPKPVPGPVMFPVPKSKGRGLELSLLLFSAWNTQWFSPVKPPRRGSDGWSSPEIGPVPKVLVKSNLDLCHLSPFQCLWPF